MSKAKVLFFAADPLLASPRGGARPQLDEDIRRILEKVRAAEYRGALEFDFRLAARADDLIQALNETAPRVVHFSGHGSSDGLLLVGRDGRAHLVSSAGLEQLFRVFRGDIRVVVLNACLTLPQAQAIAAVVGCAIGTGKEISDDAAITFGASFYRGLAFGHSVQAAFDQAHASLMLDHPGEEETMRIIARPGVDPARIFVVRENDRDETTAAGDSGGNDQDAQASATTIPTGGSPPARSPLPSIDDPSPHEVQPSADHPRRRSRVWVPIVVLGVLALVCTYTLRRSIGDQPNPASIHMGGLNRTLPPTSRIKVTVPQETQATPDDIWLDSNPEPPASVDPPPATPLSSTPPSSSDERRSQPVPAPAAGSVLDRVTLRLGPDHFQEYEIAITDPRPCRLRGRVQTIEGGSRDIDVLVLEGENYERFRQSHRYTKIFAARRTSEISLDVPLPGPGRYHLLISNKFSAFTGKLVLVEDIRWECTEGGSGPPG